MATGTSVSSEAWAAVMGGASSGSESGSSGSSMALAYQSSMSTVDPWVGPSDTILGPNSTGDPFGGMNRRYSVLEMLLIAIVAGCLSIMTVVGNVMVMVSFKIDKQLQTISNYFLFSLAIADFVIGLISMPLFTVYLLMGKWPLGSHVCDTWLALDYLASNASVLNLLIISFDRYFSVTRPLTYRARRTTRRAAFMIGCAWGISLLLWPPWIYSWPYIEGTRTVPDDECYIQFIETNHYITFGTAIAAFYVPVSIMCGLYWRIWMETEKRQKDLTNLQAGKKDNSRRSNSSDSKNQTKTSKEPNMACEATTVGEPYSAAANDEAVDPAEVEWKRSRSESSTAMEELETTYVPTAICLQENPRPYLKGKVQRLSEAHALGSQQCTKVSVELKMARSHVRVADIHATQAEVPAVRLTAARRVQEFCLACARNCRVDRDDGDDTASELGHGSPGCATPASVETPLQSSVSRCTSLNVIRDPYAGAGGAAGGGGSATPSRSRSDAAAATSAVSTTSAADGGSRAGGGGGGAGASRLHSRSHSSDSVYTILIRLPPDSSVDGLAQPSIKMIPEELPPPPPPPAPGRIPRGPPPPPPAMDGGEGGPLRAAPSEYSLNLHPGAYTGPSPSRRHSQMPDVRIPLNAKIIPKQLAKGGSGGPKKKKKKSQEKKQDKKAAKTLSAILLAFIITWTPYNVLVLLKTLLTCDAEDDCIPNELWNFSYYLCYLNSTINPMCYALCNASFRRTYVRILTCKWNNRKRHAINKGFYN